MKMTPVLVIVGCMVTLCSAFLPALDQFSSFGVGLGVLITIAGLFFLPGAALPNATELAREELQQRQAEFEEWRVTQAEAFRQQSERIEERNRDLMERSARFLEFSEYPTKEKDAEPVSADGIAVQMSEQDRKVNALLEAEAERVYEKIRKNGYTTDGTVDIDLIRNDAFDLIQRVAAIYSPDSHNPLLETSFEQLARSASRICLHILVLLEQLPLDVQKYNINELHSYVRRAVQGYGTYQQVAPWLKNFTRAAYVGRIAAGANPVTLGAWWLATELGRRGAAKVVENVVDRQAVAVLHDVVAVIGVEVANVYGPGYRQRDPAWAYGTELVELLSRFPVSRDSLAQALREITSLPLRSEYDRIYLYRCIANHRSAGFRLEDPAILPRAAREDMARRLEAFYGGYIHGKTDELQRQWQDSVETRLDLKLHFGNRDTVDASKSAIAAVQSVHSFLVCVLNASPADAAAVVESSDLMTKVPLDSRHDVLKQLPQHTGESGFVPPDLEPSSELADEYLRCLVTSVLLSPEQESHIDELLFETAGYFRRSRQEAETLLHQCVHHQLQHRASPDVSIPNLTGNVGRQILHSLGRNQSIAAVFTDAESVNADSRSGQLTLVVLKSRDGANRILAFADDTNHPVWVSDETVTIVRQKGIFLDSCELHGGQWQVQSNDGAHILLSGSISGGGFDRYFAAIRAAIRAT